MKSSIKYILSFLAFILTLSLMHSNTAQANYSSLSNTLPDNVGNGQIHMTVSIRDPAQGLLLDSPRVWIKVIANTPGAKTVTIQNRDTCNGRKTYTYYRTSQYEYLRDSTNNTLLGSSNGGCGNVTLRLSASQLTKSSLPGRENLYTALILVQQTSRGQLTTFKASASGAKLSSWGLYNPTGGTTDRANRVLYGQDPVSAVEYTYMTAFLGRPGGSQQNNYNIRFKPPCDFQFNAQNQKRIYLYWYDDDWGTSYQPNNMRIKLYEQNQGSSGLGTLILNQSGKPPFKGEGVRLSDVGKTSIVVKKGKKYTWVWENVTNSNGIQVWYPFDSGNYHFQCQDENWNVQPNLSKDRSEAPFNDSGTAAQKTNSAKSAFRKFEVKRKAKNTKPTSNGTQAKKNDHKTYVRYRVYDKSRTFSNSSSSTNKSWSPYHNRFDTTHWSDNLNPQVEKNFATLKPGWDTGPPTYQESGPLEFLLRSPQEGDRYCEQLVTKAMRSSDATNANQANYSTEQCVKLVAAKPGWHTLSEQKVERINSSDTNNQRSPQTVAGVASASGASYTDAWVGERYIVSNTLKNSETSRDRLNKDLAIHKFTQNFGDSYRESGSGSRKGNGVAPGGKIDEHRAVPTVRSSDVDKTICTKLNRKPSSSSNDSLTESSQSCLSVPPFYRLQPTVSKEKEMIEQGDEVKYSVAVKNPKSSAFPGSPTGSRNHTDSYTSGWRVKRTVKEPGDASPREFGYESTGPVIGKLEPQDVSHTVLNGRSAFSASDTRGFKIGTELCVIFKLLRSTQVANSPAETETCWLIAKYPKVQFQNADVKAGASMPGSEFNASDSKIYASSRPQWSKSQPNSNMYGSWVEYGAFAKKTISGFGSGATPADMASSNSLTFANTPSNNLGNFDDLSLQTDYLAQVTDETATAVSASDAEKLNILSSKAPGEDKRPGQYIVDGDVKLDGVVLSESSNVILRVKGTATISGDISYGDSYDSLSKIPRLKIIADHIVITKGVSRVDAWLITPGVLKTCDTEPASTTTYINGCSRPLIVNGPVSVGRLALYRTYGADATLSPVTQNERAAEVFNLRPDQILTNYLKDNAANVNKFRTVFEKDLPPRY